MAIVEGSVPVSTTGDALRTFEQETIAGTVHTEAVALVHPGDPNIILLPYTDTPPSDAVAMPVRVVGSATRADIFGHQISVQPYNQIEMRLDASDWQDFTDQAVAGGGSGGSVTQGSGLVTVATGTAATGSATLYSVDDLEYRPGVGIYAGGTAVFSTGATGCNQYAGLIDTNLTLDEALVFTRIDGVFGILHRSGGAEVSFTAQADWNVDPCSGAVDSGFTRDGTVETLDPAAYGGPYFVEAGLFGFAGWRASVWSPDNGFIVVHEHKNFSGTPVFRSNSFKVALRAVKTSGAASHTIKAQCWVGGTYSSLTRMAGALSDRTLTQTVRSVAWGKATNGTYVRQAFNNQGRALVTNDSVGPTGSAVPTEATLLGGENDSGALTAVSVNAYGELNEARRESIASLSFVETLTALGSYQTSWVEILRYRWLDFTTEVASSAAALGTIEFTDAADPNVTPPGASDIVRTLQQTIGGTALGAPANVLDFGVDTRLRWVRMTAADLTGGQTIKVRTYGKQATPNASMLPLAATVTRDFRAPLMQSVLRAFDPSNEFQAVRYSGLVASQSSTTTILAAASFTGSAWVDTTGFVGVSVFLKSDAVTAAMGVKLQISYDDGVTVHYEDPRTYDAAPDGVLFKWSIVTPGAHVRLVVTAGVSNMTNLVLKTYLLAQETEDVSLRAADEISGEMVGDLVKAQLVALKADGTGVNAEATASGNIQFALAEHVVATPIKALSGGGSVLVRTIGTTAAQLDSTALPNRKGISIKADEDNTNSIWYGYADTVTTSTGFRLSPGESKEWDHDENTNLWAISDATGQTVYVDQVADTP